jgi:hypothetical protein
MYPGWIDWQPELWDESVRRMDFSSTLREIESAFLLWRLSLSFLMAVGYLSRRQWGLPALSVAQSLSDEPVD